MAAPTFIASYSAGYTTTTTPKTVSVTTQAGDVVVVYSGAVKGGAGALGTPSGNGITFTLQKSIDIDATWSDASIWTGTDATGGTGWTLTESYAGGFKWGFTCLVFRNSNGIGASNKNNNAGIAATVSLTTTQDNSTVVVFSVDWSAQTGASHVWSTVNGITPTAGNGLERDFVFNPATYTVYGAYYNDAGVTGSNTFGVSLPSTLMKFSIVAVEVTGILSPPLSQYNFNEGSGTTAHDLSGNGNNLTASNTSTSWDTTNPKNGAGAAKAEFTGIFGPNSLSTTWTVMCWVRRDGTWPAGQWAAAIGNVVQNFYIDTSPDNSYAPALAGSTHILATTPLPLGTWMHIAAVSNATTTTLYVNGVSEGGNGVTPAINFGDSNIWVVAGTAATSGDAANWNGAVDDVQVFSTALTQSQIVAKMNIPIDQGGSGVAWLIA